MIDIKKICGPGPVSKRNNVDVWILHESPVVPSTFQVLAMNKEFSPSRSKRISSMFTKFSNVGYSRVLSKVVACFSAYGSDWNKAPCGRLIAAELTVRPSSAFRSLPVRSPMA